MTDSEKYLIEKTLAYCWNHTDTIDEERIVLWVAEHIATTLRAAFQFGGWMVDGESGSTGSSHVYRIPEHTP